MGGRGGGMGGQGGKGGMGGEMKDIEKNGGMEAQVTFFIVALTNTMLTADSLFRYRSSSTYYDDGDVLGTNYWKLANQLSGYFWLGAFGIATITQLLAMYGVANGINLGVWIYGLEMFGGLVGLVTSIMMFLGYDKAYTVANDEDTSASD